MNKSIIILSMTFFAYIVNAADIQWDGGGSDMSWFTVENWVGDILPGVNDKALFVEDTSLSTNPILINGSKIEISDLQLGLNDYDKDNFIDIYSDINVTNKIRVGYEDYNGAMVVRQFSGAVTSKCVQVYGNKSTVPQIYEMHGGTLVLTGFHDNYGDLGIMLGSNLAYRNSNLSIFKHFAGTTTIKDSALAVGSTVTLEDGGGFQMKGGTLNLEGTFYVGYGYHGVMIHTNGTVIAASNLNMGNRAHSAAQGDGTYVISDSAVLDIDGTVVLGTTSSASTETTPLKYGLGNFIVSGSGSGSINVNGWLQKRSTTYPWEGVGIFTPEVDSVGVIKVEVDGNVTFDLNTWIAPTNLPGCPVGQWVEVMNWTGSIDNGTSNTNLMIAPYVPEGEWDFRVDDVNKKLEVKYNGLQIPGSIFIIN